MYIYIHGYKTVITMTISSLLLLTLQHATISTYTDTMYIHVPIIIIINNNNNSNNYYYCDYYYHHHSSSYCYSHYYYYYYCYYYHYLLLLLLCFIIVMIFLTLLQLSTDFQDMPSPGAPVQEQAQAP